MAEKQKKKTKKGNCKAFSFQADHCTKNKVFH